MRGARPGVRPTPPRVNWRVKVARPPWVFSVNAGSALCQAWALRPSE